MASYASSPSCTQNIMTPREREREGGRERERETEYHDPVPSIICLNKDSKTIRVICIFAIFNKDDTHILKLCVSSCKIYLSCFANENVCVIFSMSSFKYVHMCAHTKRHEIFARIQCINVCTNLKKKRCIYITCTQDQKIFVHIRNIQKLHT